MLTFDDFEIERESVYKNEIYYVRDNGAVLRKQREINRVRPNDNNWTFGKVNKKTGYLNIVSVQIHRIVATAFHGEAPTKEHVVDHIDTNRQNNRPDNLRWVTRLENILLNPITIKRIEISCNCNIEDFLNDPARFRNKLNNSKYDWMCKVSIEEARVSLDRLLAWAESDNIPSGGSLGRWISNRGLPKTNIEEFQEFISSKTPNARQKNWKIPSEFPCCPQKISTDSITDYMKNLNIDSVFSRNQYSDSIIEDCAMSKDKYRLWVMCRSNDRNAIKPYSLAEITLDNSYFIHENCGSFFKRDGAEKQFTIIQGLDWTGGETYDDLF